MPIQKRAFFSSFVQKNILTSFSHLLLMTMLVPIPVSQHPVPTGISEKVFFQSLPGGHKVLPVCWSMASDCYHLKRMDESSSETPPNLKFIFSTGFILFWCQKPVKWTTERVSWLNVTRNCPMMTKLSSIRFKVKVLETLGGRICIPALSTIIEWKTLWNRHRTK